MSMRTYGVNSQCMALTFNDMYDLIKNKGNRSSVYLKDFFDENGKLLELDEVFDDIGDLASYIGYYIGDFDGILHLSDYDNIEFRYECVVVIDLKKNTLFEAYKDYNEIYEELRYAFGDIGITLDDDYIKQHFGFLDGVYEG